MKLTKLREILKNVLEGAPISASSRSLPNAVKGTTVYPKSGGGAKVVGRKLTPDDLRKTMLGK